MKHCKHCGGEFEPVNPKGEFCKTSCRVAWHRKQSKGGGVDQVDGGKGAGMGKVTPRATNTPKRRPVVRKKASEGPKLEPIIYTVSTPTESGWGVEIVDTFQLTDSNGTANSVKHQSTDPKPQKGCKPTWIGPRMWPSDLSLQEVRARLKRIGEYRQWALGMGLPDKVITRAEVEGLLLQAGADPRLASIVIQDQPEMP